MCRIISIVTNLIIASAISFIGDLIVIFVSSVSNDRFDVLINGLAVELRYCLSCYGSYHRSDSESD